MTGFGARGTFVHLYLNGLYWGLYNPVAKDAPNLLTDDADAIRAKWQAVATDRSFALNPMLDRVLQAALKPPAPVTGTTPAVSSNP